jgi:drug/metabolite transporter (DMT)-like permease
MRTRPDPLDRHTLYGLLAILLWSTTVALIRSLAERIGPLTAASSVYLLAGALSLAQIGYSGHLKKQIRGLPRSYLFGCGVLFAFYMFSIYFGIGLAGNRLQAIEIGLLNYLWPALILVFSVFLLNKRAHFLLIPGTLVSMLGVFLVLTQGTSISWSSFSRNVTSNIPAYALGLTAGISWALYSTLARRWGGSQSGGGIPFFMGATGLLLLVLRFFHAEQSQWSFRAVSEMLFMSLATLVAYASWDRAMRKGDVVLLGACSYFIPLLSTLVSCLYLEIAPELNLWLGCGAIILGSLISWASVSDRTPL